MSKNEHLLKPRFFVVVVFFSTKSANYPIFITFSVYKAIKNELFLFKDISPQNVEDYMLFIL